MDNYSNRYIIQHKSHLGQFWSNYGWAEKNIAVRFLCETDAKNYCDDKKVEGIICRASEAKD